VASRRLVAQLAEQVPDRQVDGRDGLQRQSLPAVVCRRAPHLVPDALDVARVRALHEPAQVLLDEVAPRFAGRGHADASRSVVRLDLDDACAERVDAPRRARSRVLGVHRHGVGNRLGRDAVDPVLKLDIVAVGALIVILAGVCGERAHLLDSWDGPSGRHRRGCGQQAVAVR